MARGEASKFLLKSVILPRLATPVVLSTVVAVAAAVPGALQRGEAYSDGQKCYLGVITYDLCCLPEPRDDCWDDFHTAERCCHGLAVSKPSPGSNPCFGLGPLTYDYCCLPSPNADCWTGEYTPERCCKLEPVNMSARKPADREGFMMDMNGKWVPDTAAAMPGNPECWFGSLTFESCCLPTPQETCFRFDKYFTAERCCSDNLAMLKLSPLQRLWDELLTDVNPYTILTHVAYQPEEHYPDSHLTEEIVRNIINFLAHFGRAVNLWLEVGSFIGMSVVTTANVVKKMDLPIGIVAMDPWTGDTGMWATRKAMRIIVNHPNADSALKMDQFGHSRIHETFLANVHAKGHHDIVMPLRITSISGLRLILQLYQDKRIQVVPQVIYLDSAHEEGETLLELRTAWQVLPSPGILFGDDWSWPGVRHDVTTFVEQMRLESFSEEELRMLDTSEQVTAQPLPGVALIAEHDGTWLMMKRSGGPAPPRPR